MNRKTFAVLGLGKFGRGVADGLAERGAEVLAVDKDERVVEQNASKYTQAIIADLTDSDEIQQLGLENMDAVIIGMSENLEASIMCVMAARECGVKKIIAKVESQRKGEILKKIGATDIVYPERESGTRTAFRLLSRDIMQFFDLSSDLVFVEMVPLKEWDGRKLSELELRVRHGINVIAVRRGEKVHPITHFDAKEMVIHREEPLLIVISREELDKLEG